MRKFNRVTSRRKLFRKSLLTSLIDHKRIETTVARAKEIRPLVEKMVTMAKRKDVAHFRLLCAKLPKHAAERLYHDIAPLYVKRDGGYTRIIKQATSRKRDAAPLAVIEFV